MRQAEGGGYEPLDFSPLIELEFHKIRAHGRYDTQRLVPRFKVSGQSVTPEVMSVTQRLWLFCHFFLHTIPLKVAAEHHRNPFVKPRRMI